MNGMIYRTYIQRNIFSLNLKTLQLNEKASQPAQVAKQILQGDSGPAYEALRAVEPLETEGGDDKAARVMEECEWGANLMGSRVQFRRWKSWRWIGDDVVQQCECIKATEADTQKWVGSLVVQR